LIKTFCTNMNAHFENQIVRGQWENMLIGPEHGEQTA